MTDKPRKSKDKEREDKGKISKLSKKPPNQRDSPESPPPSTSTLPQRTGYLEMRDLNNNWRVVFCILTGGSFFYYKNSTEPEPLGVVHLKSNNATFEESIPNEKRQHHFAFSKPGPGIEPEYLFVGAFSGSKELACWRKDIETAILLDPQPTPSASNQVKKMGIADRTKKGVASKAAVSVLGKRVIKILINDQTQATLNALKNLVRADTSVKKADELEKMIVKVSVKAYITMDSGFLRASDFLPADKLLRSAFELLVKVYSYGRKRGQKESKDQEKIISSALERIETLLKATEKNLTEVLGPHLKEKNKSLISSIFKEVGNKAFLQKTLNDTVFSKTPNLEKQKHVQTLVDAMEYYTQFHYHM